MRHTIRYWFTKKKLMLAQLRDLQRQLQEAWDKCDTLITERALLAQDVDHLRNQLNRVARERFQERELRLAAEAKLLDRYTVGDKTLARAAKELRDEYLEQLANEEE